jgi:hypothetical protein
MIKKLIVTADDFGFNTKINRGIISAHKNGVVTGTSIIVTREGFQEAVDLAKENPKLSVGIHIDLDKFFTVDHTRGVIADFNITGLPLDEIKTEIKNQIELFKSKTGFTPDCMTSHHHSHCVNDIFPIVTVLCKEYGISGLRLPKKFFPENRYIEMKTNAEQNGLITTTHFIEGWYWGNIDEEFTTAELMTHPGYGEIWREYEMGACCDPKLTNYLREKNVQLITYKDLITA